MNSKSVPTKSHSIVRENKMYSHRLYYIKGIQSYTPTTCPFCAKQLTEDNTGQVYCPQCGLVCQDSTEYSAGVKHCLPYGLKLM